MYRLAIIVTCLVSIAARAQSLYPGTSEGLIKTHVEKTECRAFDLADVRLMDGRMRENLKRDSAWMVSIDVNRLVHSFRNNAGVYAGREGGYEAVKKYGGWESLDCDLRGHTTGHLLSAYALMYAATGSEIFKLKGDSIVDALAEVQAALKGGYLSAFPEELINRNLRGKGVWAPWYTLHKLFAGLIDQYTIAGNERAFGIVNKMAAWAYNKLHGQTEQTRRLMLRNEFGGMNDAMYALYSLTGDTTQLALARYFYHNDVLDPLADGNYDFGTKHTNTFIPKIIGQARSYELFGDTMAREMAQRFMHEVTCQHCFSTGSCSQKEHFFDPGNLSKFINGYTGETCCTYNMLKLARHLMAWNPDAQLADYYERALLNHILAQQDTATGMVCYFLPLKSGSHKVYSTPEESFWCCVGSGFESHSKYAEAIYMHSSDKLYVNLFAPSVLDWKERGVKITQKTEFPYSGHVDLTIDASRGGRWTLALRYPGWSGKPDVRVNGKKIKIETTPSSYINIERRWRQGDRVEIEYPMSLHLETTNDDPQCASVLYGPVVLVGDAGSCGMTGTAPFSDPTVRNDYYTYDYHIPVNLNDSLDISHGLENVIKCTDHQRLHFETTDGRHLMPIFDHHHNRHIIYWKI